VTDTSEDKDGHYRSLFLSSNPSDTQSQAFSHILPSLPHPTSLSSILSDLRTNITKFLDLYKSNPAVHVKPMLGEVGLDRSFRIPFIAYDPALPVPPEASENAAHPRFTPFYVPVEHQLAILKAQLALAVELGVNVSLHSVKAQQATVALLDDMQSTHGESWSAISVDMHSCGVSAETWCDIEVCFLLLLTYYLNTDRREYMMLVEAAFKCILFPLHWDQSPLLKLRKAHCSRLAHPNSGRERLP
jgi:hypothetical protein